MKELGIIPAPHWVADYADTPDPEHMAAIRRLIWDRQHTQQGEHDMNTLEQLQQHLAGVIKEYRPGQSFKPITKRVDCADGTTMSVQASELHYSTPRTNTGPYSHVEVWMCGVVHAWDEYGEGYDDDTDEARGPYGYVPISAVVTEIDRRGGLVSS